MPAVFITISGAVAQLVRALRSHRRGQGFNSLLPHHINPIKMNTTVFRFKSMLISTKQLRNKSMENVWHNL